MRYHIMTYTSECIGVDCIVNMRADAKLDTLVHKSVERLYDELYRLGLIGARATVHHERPNIWTNGGCGFISLDDGERVYSVTIQREDGCTPYIG